MGRMGGGDIDIKTRYVGMRKGGTESRQTSYVGRRGSKLSGLIFDRGWDKTPSPAPGAGRDRHILVIPAPGRDWENASSAPQIHRAGNPGRLLEKGQSQGRQGMWEGGEEG